MKIITVAQLAISVLLTISILLQNRGSGIGVAYGDSFGGYYTKRGMEKFLFYFSIILGTIFIVLALANVIMSGK